MDFEKLNNIEKPKKEAKDRKMSIKQIFYDIKKKKKTKPKSK